MGDVYGLHHAKLNVEVPPRSMWMNLGYWTEECFADGLTTAQSFEIACKALFDKLLLCSGCLDGKSSSIEKQSSLRRKLPGLKILDLGVGCGDQTLRLFDHWTSSTGDKIKASSLSYTGLTENKSQCNLAQERLKSIKPRADCAQRIIWADAAQPDIWPEKLSKSLTKGDSGTEDEEYWVLALDSLYHFRPSREPIFSFAFSEAQASIVAFDLLLAHRVSFFNRLLLRLVCILLRVPFSNFVTADQYKKLLERAGYSSGSVEIDDISDRVFAPLARNLEARHVELKRFGLGGLGVYRIAALIFRWFATSGVVRGCLVIARQDPGKK